MAKVALFSKMQLEDIVEGMTCSYSQTITDSDIKAFSGISGDKNPIHMDKEYASQSRFKSRIAHGMFTASFFSALFGTKIPGEGCVYESQTLNFKRPVYEGDTVVAKVTVKHVDHERRRVTFNTECYVDGKVVTDGKAVIYVPFDLKRVLVTEKDILTKYKGEILKLFEVCFQRKIDERVWDWAYKENPLGNPIVSLCFDGDKLVGHYAVIPIPMAVGGQKVQALLSMTTMVHPAYRKEGLFVSQAEEVYIEAEAQGYSLVCGFPNKNSIPGFRKRLGWTIIDTLEVVKVCKRDIAKYLAPEESEFLKFDIKDREGLNWRLQKPGSSYFKISDSILKRFRGGLDLVYRGIDIDSLDNDLSFSMLVNKKNKEIESVSEGFDYAFGYRFLNNKYLGVDFKLDLLLSDVF